MGKTKNMAGGSGTKIKRCRGSGEKNKTWQGGQAKKKIMGGGSAKFSIPHPPQELKWNSPQVLPA